MALKEYLGENRCNEILNEVEPLVTEFDKLPKDQKLEVASEVFGRMKTLEKESNDLLEHMGDLVIENNELQEENHMLKIDLKDLNKYAPEKYEKLNRALISNSGKKNIAKQYLLNKLMGLRPPPLQGKTDRNLGKRQKKLCSNA
jgi:regulator of replication initiation timing